MQMFILKDVETNRELSQYTSFHAAMKQAVALLLSSRAAEWQTKMEGAIAVLTSENPPIKYRIGQKEKVVKDIKPVPEKIFRFRGNSSGGGWYGTHVEGEIQNGEVFTTLPNLKPGDYLVAYTDKRGELIQTHQAPPVPEMAEALRLKAKALNSSVVFKKYWEDKLASKAPPNAHAVFLANVSRELGTINVQAKRYLGKAPEPLNKYR